MDAEEEEEDNDRTDQGKDTQNAAAAEGTHAEEGNEPEDVEEQLGVEGERRPAGLTSPLEVALLAEALPLQEDENRGSANEQVDDNPDEEPAPSGGSPPGTIHQTIETTTGITGTVVVNGNLGTSDTTGGGGSGRGSVVRGGSRVVEELRVTEAQGQETPEDGNEKQDRGEDGGAAEAPLTEWRAGPVALLEALANVAFAAAIVFAALAL